MAAVMAAGMVPPLALALATVVRPGAFSAAERENGKAAWLLGASFISEGAIPFAAADPLRVIPPVMLGGAVTGAIIMGTGAELSAPHGGIFVFFAINGIVGFLIALVAGTLVGGAAVMAAKQFHRKPASPSLTPSPARPRKDTPCPATPSPSARPSACTPAPPRSSPRPPPSSASPSPCRPTAASPSTPAPRS